MEYSFIYRLSRNDLLYSLQNRRKISQTNSLLVEVKIHEVELDRLGNIGVLECLIRDRCVHEGFTLGSDQV